MMAIVGPGRFKSQSLSVSPLPDASYGGVSARIAFWTLAEASENFIVFRRLHQWIFVAISADAMGLIAYAIAIFIHSLGIEPVVAQAALEFPVME
jgi:hypothetical protein